MANYWKSLIFLCENTFALIDNNGILIFQRLTRETCLAHYYSSLNFRICLTEDFWIQKDNVLVECFHRGHPFVACYVQCAQCARYCQ